MEGFSRQAICSAPAEEADEDVDGGWSTFVDSDFIRSTPAGGDYAGHTGETALAALEGDLGALTLEERAECVFLTVGGATLI